MATETKGWDITLVDCMLAGIRIDGFGENDAIQISPIGDLSTYSQGQDGEGVFSYAPNVAHEISITVRRTSRSNNVLTSLVALSTLFTNQPIFPIIIIDRNTGSTYEGFRGACTKYPDVSLGQAVSDLTWTFVLSDMVRTDVQLT